MAVKNIWHVGGWSWNYGDRALQVATQKIVQDHTEHHLNFVAVDNQKTWFSPQLIDKLNTEADMLLLGGGGFIFHRPMDRSRSGWQFNIELDDISKIDVPIAVYGIGYNKFPHDVHEFPQLMWDTIQAVIDKSVAFSVRNNGTYEVMEAAGLNMDKVTVVPDSAMFLEPYPFSHPKLKTNKLKIGLNWATDRWEQRFGSLEAASQALDTTLNVLRERAEVYDASVYLIEHLLPNDLNVGAKTQMVDEFRLKMKGIEHCVLRSDMNQELYPPFDYLAPFFADIYRQMDVMLSMRGHANILAFGQNTPMVGLGEHNKVKWFLEDIQQEGRLVKLDKDTETNIDELRKAIDRAVRDNELIKQEMDAEKTKQSIIKDTFVEKIVQAL